MKPVDRRVLDLIRPARLQLVAMVAISAVGGVLAIGQILAIAALVAAVVEGGRDPSPAVVALAGTTALRAAASWGADALAAKASAVVTVSLRRRIMTAAMKAGGFGQSRSRTGEMALLVTRGVTAIDPYVTRYLPTLAVAAVLPVLTVVAIASRDLASAATVLITLPLIPVFAILIGAATEDRARRQWQTLSTLAGHFVDVIKGLPTLVVYRRERNQASVIRSVTDRYRAVTLETLKIAFLSSTALELVATISIALVAVLVGLRVANGGLDLETALVVLLLAPEAYWPLRRVGAEYHAAAEGTATFAEVTALLDPAPDRYDGSVRAVPAAAAITATDLTLRYPDRDEPAIRDWSGRIEPTGITAIVGPSGAGKSTLLAALAGLLEPSEGSIHVGNTPLSDIHPDAWRSRVAWIPQRPWIPEGTIAENVRIGLPGASDSQVLNALERVKLSDTVAALPHGIHTTLGPDGEGLSGGERARLVLARAVISGRSLILADEPSAHLDPETERTIIDTLRWLARRSAVVVVAHRNSMVSAADRVLEVPPPPTPRIPSQPHPAPATTRGDPVTTAVRTPRPAPPPRRRLLLGAMLGAAASASGVALTATAGWLIVRAAEGPPILMLMVAIVGVRAFGLARPCLRYLERIVSHNVALRLLAERRARVYDTIAPLVPGRLGRQRGDVLASIVDDVDSLLDDHLRVRAPIVSFALVGSGSVLFAFLVSPEAGGVLALSLIGGAGLAIMTTLAGVRRTQARFVDARGRMTALVEQTLGGTTDLVMWQAGAGAVGEITTLAEVMGKSASRAERSTATGRAITMLAAGAAMMGLTPVAVAAANAGTVTGPVLALLMLFPLALNDVTGPLADAIALSVRTRAATARLMALAELTPAVDEPDVAVPLGPFRGANLRNVSAGWGKTMALSDISVEIPRGSRVGVIGPSGSGKSTLAAILLRFIDPIQGHYLLGETDATVVAGDELHATVGLVDDDPHIFASTVRENLRLARPTASDGELTAALETVRLGPWLAGLREGLDTMIGDGFIGVSGGERARIGLARSILAEQPMLVLDEPTAHLDTVTARAVATDLLAGGSERTVIWITHDGLGLDSMDRVIDLGEHRDLLRESVQLAVP